MYGTQTSLGLYLTYITFENDVNMYGTQTVATAIYILSKFENDVNMYGTQTLQRDSCCHN